MSELIFDEIVAIVRDLQDEVAALKERCAALQAENEYWVNHWQKNWKASLLPDLPKADGMRVGPGGMSQPSDLGGTDE